MLAKTVVSEGLTVRAVEDLVRDHGGGGVPDGATPDAPGTSRSAGADSPRRLPPPGILELEELLSNHLNTRVKVDLSSKRGKVVVEFATLEDLERIYKLMVGRPEPSVV
jgi:ParB family chromosome partitioning protein